jgi:hypothetical protein
MSDHHTRTANTPHRDLFPDHDLTPDERAAHDEDPRPGSCFGPGGGDSYLLTQSDTDILIRVELWSQAPHSARAQFEALIGTPRWRPGCVTDPLVPTTYQRGGVDSDPLVRLLAYRAWGNRDRTWFAERGVRSGESLTGIGRDVRGEIEVALAWPGESVLGRAVADARAGELVEVVKTGAVPKPRRAYDPERFRVTDRLRVEPVGRG